MAAILKSPGAGARKAVVLLAGIGAGAAVYWFVAAEQLGLPSYGSLGIDVLTADALDAGRLLSFPPQVELIFGIAPFALGAGYITGRPGLFVLAGGWMPATVAAPEAPSPYGPRGHNDGPDGVRSKTEVLACLDEALACARSRTPLLDGPPGPPVRRAPRPTAVGCGAAHSLLTPAPGCG